MVIAGLVILGLCLGSFINALVYRLHWQETNRKASKIERRRYSIKDGRSFCPACKHVLAPKDLVPVLSWLWLWGKCRYCRKPISWQYPLVEASTAVLFASSYLFWPHELSAGENIPAFIVWLVFLTGAITLIIYDIKYLILPNKIIFPLALVAIFGLIIELLVNYDIEKIKAGIIGLLIGGGLFYVLFQISNGAWIGGGDVKLGFLLGFIAGGPARALLMLFLASLLGTLYSVPMILARRVKPKSRIPFGPFLITALIIVQLFGAAIIDWYANLSGSGY